MAIKKIALIGNPNTGKSSIFNQLTGLKQHIGNFPGVTVERKTGSVTLANKETINLVDLPGTYSLNPHSKDEEVVFDLLSTPSHKDHPNAIIVVVDFSNLERNLLLFTQIHDLGIPTILVCNMMDVANQKEITIDFEKLTKQLGNVTIVKTTAKKNKGLENLKTAIQNLDSTLISPPFVQKYDDAKLEAEIRFTFIKKVLKKCNYQNENKPNLSQKLDQIFTHPILSYLIFGVILLLIFQSVFSFAEAPMDFIDGQIGNLSHVLKANLPSGIFTNLLTEGIIPGIGGVLIFIPQIAILFLFIAILEESGYMSRVVFIMDRLMRPLGLSGKSVVPLISSMACAIPAIMAARTINSWKDRMITILVAPLVSCSARIPVYTLLIALIIPDETVFGVLNMKGLVLFGLYGLGFISVIVSAVVFKFILKSNEKSFLVLELPEYKLPSLQNLITTLIEKVKVFVIDAGKIILAVSIVLWGLASYGPSNRMENAVIQVELNNSELPTDELANLKSAAKLQNSYIGILGKAIEPAIAPLGYDWKIGISLITSFAAREVFVGSMATIYSVGDDFEESTALIDKMKSEKNLITGEKIYTVATGGSLMVFYVFAMQCMSTLAIVKRETKSWKWPLIQLGYMSALAYFGAWITYAILT